MQPLHEKETLIVLKIEFGGLSVMISTLIYTNTMLLITEMHCIDKKRNPKIEMKAVRGCCENLVTTLTESF